MMNQRQSVIRNHSPGFLGRLPSQRTSIVCIRFAAFIQRVDKFWFLLAVCFPLLTACTRPVLEPGGKGILGIGSGKLFSAKEPEERLWRTDLAIKPYAEFDDQYVIIHHIRNCRYRTESDYDVRHYDMEFELSDVQTVDFLIVPFANNPLLAHTMFSFGLRDGRYFIISVEARLDQGDSYSPVRGLTNKFELMYVIGDERDLIPLRTDIRKVDVFLYPARTTPEQVQDLLIDMLQRANQLQRSPEYYDTINNNCTTNLVQHINKLRPGRIPNDLRVLLPGHSDRLAYELGLLDVNGSFEVAREQARITQLSQLYKDSPDFSHRIRRKVPPLPLP